MFPNFKIQSPKWFGNLRQLMYEVYSTRCQVPFYLWRLGPAIKQYKVQKYYDQDCRPAQH